jgi:cbb3-type cytochrome oxidase subunit 3
MQSATKSRPRGVTIAATVNIIVGIAGLIFGIGFIAQDALLHPIIESAFDLPRRNLSAEQASTPGFGIALGAAFVPLAIVSFIVASGLLKGRRWAWTAALVLSIISMVWYAFTVVIIPSNGGRTLGVIIGAVTIYYLYRPHVKAYFDKEVR